MNNLSLEAMANIRPSKKPVPLSQVSWEHAVTRKFEQWIQSVNGHSFKDYSKEVEDHFEKVLDRPCIAVSNGTAALHLAVRMLNLPPGSEIIIPTLTYVACANVALYENLVPVFIDVNRQTWCLDSENLKEVIEHRRKRGAKIGAVMMIHLYGQSSSVDEIKAICDSYNIPIIEDVAQALGGHYQ